MTLTDTEKKEYSRYRLKKAGEMLSDAKLLLEAGSYRSSVSRSYFAVYTAVKSLLILRGIDTGSHDETKTMLSKEFIKTGVLPKETGEIFRSIQARRIDSDYEDFIDIGSGEANTSYNDAMTFVNTITGVIENIIKKV